jgi:hypothetical protein
LNGVPRGYTEFFEALADEDHERHDQFIEWIGEDYDPENLDNNEINEALAKLAPLRATKAPKPRKPRS